jgi:hypothetical protein
MDGPWAEREDFGDPATTLRELRQALSWKVPSTILRRSAARAVEEHIDACLRSEWAEIEGPDPLRKMHRLLIGTDQRQHLTFHNETIQYQGFELALPFFDSEVVQWILSRPARPFLRHAFYNQWIRSFGPSYSSVPWQHYPGHLPGPLPLPADLVVQWQAGAGLRRPVLGTSEAKILLFDALRGRLPSDVFHRLRVTIAALSTLMGLRNYEYALRQVRAVSNPLSAYDPGEISDS